MNRKALTTIQIVLAIIVLAYWILPDFMLGPLDDGVIAALAFLAEIVLFVVRAVNTPQYTESSSRNTSYQQYYQDKMLEDYAQKYSNNKWALRDPFSFANKLGAIAFVLRQPLHNL